ncbi:MAG: T9SS type A sorting domain-containing protein, partial [Flavobacteriales bacterium]|nr:T9SS type A sorting domain-containing protein [Flavobacteriales bacterium]
SYYRGHFFESNGEYELTGAIINGETQGYVHTDPEFIALGLEEHVSGGHALWPNPADDRLIVAASSTGSILQINDPNGRMVLRHRIASFREIIDIHTLPPGIYIVTLEGYSPQRVVIAR